MRERDAGPGREVAVRRRPEVAQVAPRELGLRLPRAGRLEPGPLVGAGEGPLAALLTGVAQASGERRDGQHAAARVVALARLAPRQHLRGQPAPQLLVQRVAAEHAAVERLADRDDGPLARRL